MWLDITRPIEPGALIHPEDPAPRLQRYSDMAKGEDYNLTRLDISLHTGTHLDAPRHFVPDGVTIDELPAGLFICQAHVIDLGTDACAEPRHLEGCNVRPGDAVLLRTANGELPRDRMAETWVYISVEAAHWCVGRRVAIVGMDYIEVEAPDAPHGSYPVHQTLLPAGVLLLENLDLRGVAPGLYRLICLPLRIIGAEAAPCRAVLGPLEAGAT